MNNKIFCTFTNKEDLDNTILKIYTTYTLTHNRVFQLYAEEQDEYLLTYNVEVENLRKFPENTILVHRKKDYNVLYTVNALNMVVLELNHGVLDRNFKVNWKHFRNSVLLTRGTELRIIKTKLDRVIDLSL